MVVGRLLVATLPPADDAEVGERGGLGGAIADEASGLAGMAVNDHGVGMVPAGLKVAVQGSGQTGGVAGRAPHGRMHGHGDDGGSLGIKPGARLGWTGYLGSRRPDGGNTGAEVLFGRDEDVHRA